MKSMIKHKIEAVRGLPLHWHRRGPLAEMYGGGYTKSPRLPGHDLVDALVADTDALGEQPLWEGYGQGHASRTPRKVRTQDEMGRFFTDLVVRLQPKVVVEFGAAFGVSGMYWLTGLERIGAGHLYSFEVNDLWADQAERNFQAISSRHTLTRGVFEDNLHVLDDQSIDLAFIDAIHTSKFVEPQFALVAERLAPGGLVVLDDLNFSDDMQGCWQRLRVDARVISAAEITRRVGLLQLR